MGLRAVILRQLASVLSGEYFAIDQRIDQIVCRLVGLAPDTHH